MHQQTGTSFLDRFCFQIFQFSQQHRLINNNDRVVISVSGGPDSVCLLHVLHSFRIKVKLDLHLVHFHHGLRKESDEEELFVTGLARSFSIPFSVCRSDRFKGRKGMQNEARQWRYQQLEQIRADLGYQKIALGHHLDDLVETQLWRMMRGSSLFSLSPIQVSNPPYIRPLLNTPKSELVRYLRSIKQEWREDISNQSNDYTRNYIRNKIMPLMNDCAGGKLADKMLGINSDALYLKQLFEEQVPPGSYECSELEYSELTALNPLLAHELIHRFLLFHQENEITRENIERIYQLVKSGKGNWQIHLKSGRIVYGIKKTLMIKKRALDKNHL